MSTPHIRRLSLRANIAWTATGIGVYTAAQWSVLVITAKVLDVEAVGRLALGLAVTAPVFMFANLSLRHVQASDALSRFRFFDYLHLRIATSVCAMLAVLTFLAIARHDSVTAVVIALLALAKTAESLSDIHHGLFQKLERMDWVCLSLTAKAAITSFGFLVATIITRDLRIAVATLLAGWLVVLFFFDAPLARRHRCPGIVSTHPPINLPDPTIRAVHLPTLKTLATIATPLGVVATLISLNSNLPRYFVAAHRGNSELGIFAAIAYLMSAVGMLINAVGQAATPRLSQHYAAGDRRRLRALWVRLLCFAALLGLAGVLVVMLLGKPILLLFYGPEYANHADVLVYLAIASCFAHGQSVCWYFMTATQNLRIQTLIYGAAIATTAGISAWLVPSRGLTGAAIAVLASYCVGMASGLLVGCRTLSAMRVSPSVPIGHGLANRDGSSHP